MASNNYLLFSNYKDTEKFRDFATILYLDSMNKEAFEILENLQIKAFVSDLHDKDLNADGTVKKPHYHLQIEYDSTKSIRQVKKLFEELGALENGQVVASKKGYARYLCHLDNPEKAQYLRQKVKSFGGWDYNEVIEMRTDKYGITKEIMTYIRENNIKYYCEIVDYALNNNFEWFKGLHDYNSFIIKEYIKSLNEKESWKYKKLGEDMEKNYKKLLNEETGELEEHCLIKEVIGNCINCQYANSCKFKNKDFSKTPKK